MRGGTDSGEIYIHCHWTRCGACPMDHWARTAWVDDYSLKVPGISASADAAGQAKWWWCNEFWITLNTV